MIHATLILVTIGAGLLLPGWVLAQVIPSRNQLLSALLGSALLLFWLILGFDLAGIRITPAHVRSGLCALTVTLLLILWQRRQPGARSSPPFVWRWPTRPEILWAIPALIGISAIVARAVSSPLSGVDNGFRWNYLAEQMLRLERLDFYPPVSSQDYEQYGWCDGIPPLIPILNLWTYVGAGGVITLSTAIRVSLEGIGLFYAVGKLAKLWGGSVAGWSAAGILSTSGLALWGVSMGQETGFTALSLVAMFVFLEEYRRVKTDSTLVWAGLCAAAGALSREYGLAWIVFGTVALVAQGNLRRSWIFVLTSCAVAVPWYLRNYLRTGNPFFAQSLHGLFPVPAAHQQIMEVIAGFAGLASPYTMNWVRLMFLGVLAGVPFLGGIAGLYSLRVRAWPVLFAILGVTVLWLWSIPQTAGGFSYSTRVLTPAIALGAALAGAAWAKIPQRVSTCLLFGLIVLSAESFVRSFYLPFFLPKVALFQPSSDWANAGTFGPNAAEIKLAEGMTFRAQGAGIVLDGPDRQMLFQKAGARALVLQSPDCAAMFKSGINPMAVVHDLRSHQIRFLLLSGNSEMTRQIFLRNEFFRWLAQRPPAHFDPLYLLYDLNSFEPAPSTSP